MSDVVVQQVVAKTRFRNYHENVAQLCCRILLKGNRISQQPFMREKEATNGYASHSPEMILSTTSA
jgi:hypothetical protein